MELTVFFFVAWTVGFVLFSMTKKLSLLENTFLYLIILAVNINVTWVIIDEYKLIHYTKEIPGYIAYLLNRSVITPLIILLHINLIYKYKSYVSSFLIITISIFSLLSVRKLQLFFGILTYKHWTMWLDIILFLSLHFVAFICLKLFQIPLKRELVHK